MNISTHIEPNIVNKRNTYIKTIADQRPVSIVEEYQDTFTPISYNEKNNQTFLREK